MFNKLASELSVFIEGIVSQVNTMILLGYQHGSFNCKLLAQNYANFKSASKSMTLNNRQLI